MAKRKTPRASAVAKKTNAKTKQTKPAAGAPPVSDAISKSLLTVETALFDGKKKRSAVQIGCSSAVVTRLPDLLQQDCWQITRVDMDPALEADHKGTMLWLREAAENSINVVWAQHVLHRLYVFHAKTAMAAAYRAIKDGGMLYVSVPDGQSVAAMVAHGRGHEALYTTPMGDVSANDLLFGFSKKIAEGKQLLTHHSCYTMEELGQLVCAAGFCNVSITRERYELRVKAFKLPKTDVNRVDKVVIHDKMQDVQQPPAAPMAKRGVPDLMDTPPRKWQPLGLK